MKDFDYKKSVEEIEKLLALIENPDSPLDEVEKSVSRAKALIAEGREWLRSEKEKD